MPVSLCIIVFLTTVLTNGPAAPSDEPRLLQGAWRFEREVDTRDGAVVSAGPKDGYGGLVIYTSDGYMSATLMPKGRQWTVDGADLIQFKETVETGTAYCGRYEVDPRAHTVTHIVEAGMDPSDEGKRLVRTYSLHGDTLELSGTWSYQGHPMGFTITFARVK